ncbi:hypothetical protein BHM03_00035735 [Ensete ventricosum]|nr:hypothetical protein BHM03_00035735 [Ensete ventricosum]
MFSNSGIKAKRRKPLQGAARHGHGQSPCRGGRLRPGPARKRATPARGHAAGAAANGLQTTARGQPIRGGRLRVRRPQEGSLRAEAPPARAAACKGDRKQQQHLQGRRPWRCRPQGWPPIGRVAAGGQGQPPPAQGRRRSEGEGGLRQLFRKR